MEIYIEYVIIDNLVINMLILLCVKSSLKLKTRWWRILLSSMLGTIVAVLLPLLHVSNYLLLPTKIILGVFMILIISKFYSFKEFIFTFLLFLAYTFVMGGACLATLLVFGTDLDMLLAGGYDIALPLGVILLIVMFYAYLIIGIAKYLTRRRTIGPFMRKVVLCVAEHRMEFDAFIDTGNKLTDKNSGMPVIILCFDALSKHFSKDEMEKLMLSGGKDSLFRGVHQIPYNTISGEAKNMVVFEAEKIVIIHEQREYTTNRFLVGVTYKKFHDAMNYQMLLNPSIL